MSDPQIGVLAIGILFVLIALRVPLAVALIAVPFAGIWYLVGWRAAMGSLKIIPYNFAANWALSSVPMFLLMGYVAYHAGVTRGLFKAARMWLAWMPGGLAVASVLGASGFSAVTGSSVACAAAMGRIAVPEMLRANYHPGFATGTIAAAGTIGALIPPSILFIIYGIMAQVPVGQLFVGGAVIGLMTALSYILLIVIRAVVNPAIAPPLAERETAREMFAALGEITPVLVLIVVVFAGLFMGFFTPTEAGAVGAAAAILIALQQRQLTWANFRLSVQESFATTAAIFAIAIGASLLARFVAISGADDFIRELLTFTQSNYLYLMLAIITIYLILGCFLDPMGAMLLTLPIVLPIIEAEQLSLVWFGILLAKLLEIGMITPPVGLNVFVLKSVVGEGIAIGTIFKGVMWFLVADLIVVALIIGLPGMVLYFPSLMSR